MLVTPLNDAVFKDTVAKHGSFPVRASERSAYVIDGLAAGQAYDVFFVVEGLKGVRSSLPINDDLESDTWYQVSAVSERAEGVYSQPVYAVAKTHREPARVLDWKTTPVHGSTDSLSLLISLDCSSAPTHEACGILRYEVTEKPPKGSPENAKSRQVAQGTAVVADGRTTPHVVSGLSPGKAHSISMAIETPGSNGAYGPTMEVVATTFPRAPRLVTLDAARSDTEASTVIVRYKISEARREHFLLARMPSIMRPGVIHVSLVERVGHPLALIGTMIGNQHGVGFSVEVGMSSGDDEEEQGSDAALEGSQVNEA
ncbi:unnamed protein product [Ectocarpus sp. 13 AM-2016]